MNSDTILERIIEEEAEKLSIPKNEFSQMIDQGCQIIFNENIDVRIKRFGGVENLHHDKIREILLICAKAAALNQYAENPS
jgi:hypothetical protein